MRSFASPPQAVHSRASRHGVPCLHDRPPCHGRLRRLALRPLASRTARARGLVEVQRGRRRDVRSVVVGAASPGWKAGPDAFFAVSRWSAYVRASTSVAHSITTSPAALCARSEFPRSAGVRSGSTVTATAADPVQTPIVARSGTRAHSVAKARAETAWIASSHLRSFLCVIATNRSRTMPARQLAGLRCASTNCRSATVEGAGSQRDIERATVTFDHDQDGIESDQGSVAGEEPLEADDPAPQAAALPHWLLAFRACYSRQRLRRPTAPARARSVASGNKWTPAHPDGLQYPGGKTHCPTPTDIDQGGPPGRFISRLAPALPR